jgi:hypothetical protein
VREFKVLRRYLTAVRLAATLSPTIVEQDRDRLRAGTQPRLGTPSESTLLPAYGTVAVIIAGILLDRPGRREAAGRGIEERHPALPPVSGPGSRDIKARA